jgi:beta-alanine--pyruvate transaminase
MRCIVVHDCNASGTLARHTGDILAFSPPLIVDAVQIGEIFSTAAQGRREAT